MLPLSMGLQQGLLHNVGGIELALELSPQLQACQDKQIGTELLQGDAWRSGRLVHDGPRHTRG
jgi:hypothetical protein